MNSALLRRRKFGRAVVLILVLLILFIWAEIWTELRRYEISDDEDALKAFCRTVSEQTARGNCRALLEDCNYVPGYLNLDHSGRALAASCRGKKISWKANEENENFFDIYAGEDKVAVIELKISGENGLLKLPSYSVVSITGTRSIDYAVKTPKDLMIGDVSLQALSPTESNLVIEDMQDLYQNAIDVKVPVYLVYHAENEFGIPEIRSKSEPQNIYPVKELPGGIKLIGDYPGYTMGAEFEQTIKSFAEEYASYESRYINWDVFKGSILSTTPLYLNLDQQAAAQEPADKLADFQMGEVVIGEYYAWNSSFIGVEFSLDFSYIATPSSGSVSDHRDMFCYFSLCEDGQWRVCQMTDKTKNSAVAAETQKEKEVANETSKNAI